MDGELDGGQEESEAGQAEGRGRGHGGGGVMLCADHTCELCATMFGMDNGEGSHYLTKCKSFHPI